MGSMLTSTVFLVCHLLITANVIYVSPVFVSPNETIVHLRKITYNETPRFFTCFSGPLLRIACLSFQMSVMWTVDKQGGGQAGWVCRFDSACAI